MKSNTLMIGVTAVALTFSSLAMAQDRDGRRGPDRDDRRGPPQMQHGGPGHDRGGPDRRGPPPFAHNDGRGAGPNHDFRRGGRLPYEYRNRQYVVNDWRGHRLSAPPRGYQWVQTGGDYVLAAIATGIIAQIILGQ